MRAPLHPPKRLLHKERARSALGMDDAPVAPAVARWLLAVAAASVECDARAPHTLVRVGGLEHKNPAPKRESSHLASFESAARTYERRLRARD